MARPSALQALFACRSAFVALVMSILATGLAWHVAQEQVRNKDLVRFNREVERIELAMVGGLRGCEFLIRGAQGLYAASKSVERDEWRAFVDTYDLQQHCPGMVAMSFIADVPATDAGRFVAATRSDGAPDFVIRPAGERDHYYPVKYSEPVEQTGSAVGLDLGTLPLRSAALQAARDSGRVTLSPRLQLSIDQVSASSVVLFLPVYRKDRGHENIEERRTAIEGWVAAPIRVADYMTGILARLTADIEVAVFDGSSPDDGALLHDSHPDHDAGATAASPLSRTTGITFGGRTWTISCAALPSFMASSDKVTPGLVLLCGLVLTGLLLSMMVRRQLEGDRRQAEASSRAKSEFLANMSHEIRTPMTAILGYAELLRDESSIASSPAQRREALETIVHNGRHLLSVLNDI
ncbi:MAG: CHASE domain-containing protein, partial [Planctomycetota bacterium]|nr:CHASE domain-containing protein [Planctomycetota bacterium]